MDTTVLIPNSHELGRTGKNIHFLCETLVNTFIACKISSPDDIREKTWKKIKINAPGCYFQMHFGVSILIFFTKFYTNVRMSSGDKILQVMKFFVKISHQKKLDFFILLLPKKDLPVLCITKQPTPIT